MVILSYPVVQLAAIVASAAPSAAHVETAVQTSEDHALAPSDVATDPHSTLPVTPADIVAPAPIAVPATPATPALIVIAPAPATQLALLEQPAEAEPTPSATEPTPPPAAADRPVPVPTEATGPEITADESLIDGRRRPGVQEGLPDRITQENSGAVHAPPPDAFPTDQIAVPDRWRLVQALCPDKNFVNVQDTCRSIRDPYHQNFLKGDRPINPKDVPWLPITGDDWFFVLNAISDTVVEPRSFPTPVGVQTTQDPGSLDVFGRADSFVFNQQFIVGAALIKGSTAYKPPDVEYRVTLAFNFNYADVSERRILSVKPSSNSRRDDLFVGVQEFFIDKHIGNRSDRYDFDSVRVGIQPFNMDFRGFLFQDSQLGIRLFGNRDNNRWQYNLAAFWRLEKDTNSGLNDVTQRPRDDFILHANVFRQDFPLPGITSQVSATMNLNREKRLEVDHNGFPVRPALLGDLRPREYDVFYLGYNFDGRIGRANLTGSFYAALGEDRNSFFTSEPAKIRAYFGALEASYDHDWMRFRVSGLYASGDGNPYDNKEGGFDAIFENPIFAGADTSYWIRQSVPFAGGGRAIGITGRNGILNSLRSSKEQGQSNFNNPGTMLIGVGGDFDLTPRFRVSANVNHLWFENTSTLRALRVEGSIPKEIGFDYSVAAIWRPAAVQNAVFRLSAAVLDPGKGFSDLFTNNRGDDRYYSVLLNVILAF